jgi:hypothetical protein
MWGPVLMCHDSCTANCSRTADKSRSVLIFTGKMQFYQRTLWSSSNKITKSQNFRATVKEETYYIHIYPIRSIRTFLCGSKLKPRCHGDRTYRYKRREKAVCCSLLSSTSKMGTSGELGDFERGPVMGCHISKKSVRDIATFLKLPKSTVGDVM